MKALVRFGTKQISHGIPMGLTWSTEGGQGGKEGRGMNEVEMDRTPLLLGL